MKFGVKAAEAAVQSASAQLKQSEDTLHRLEPLLPKHFATAEQVDEARTKVAVAAQDVAANEQKLNTARAQLSQLQTLLAQRPGAVAAVKQAELDLSYCKVSAPFDGRVINLNISAGAYASVGVPVFSILDTTKWYVVANFRERELRHMAPGSPATVYLVSAPNQRFHGKVQGIGWAVKPEGEIDLPPSGVPYVKRELNWIRVASVSPCGSKSRIPIQICFGWEHQPLRSSMVSTRQMNSHVLAVSSWVFASPFGEGERIKVRGFSHAQY